MPNVLIVDNGSTLTQKLAALIPARKSLCTWNTIPEHFDDFDVVVLSGSSLFPVQGSEYKLSAEIRLIRETTTPVIGICFGHELIAHSFGGTLQKLERPRKGMTDVHVAVGDAIFNKRDTFNVYENHQYSVTKTGNHLSALAHTDHSVAVLKHNTKPIYGFQFHPEHHTDEQYGDEVFLNLVHTLLRHQS